MLLLVSNLILNYSLIVTSRSYVDKLAPVAQYFVFKLRTLLALKLYYDCRSTTTISFIGVITCSTALLKPQDCIPASVLSILTSSTITRYYIIHGHVHISHTTFPGTYASSGLNQVQKSIFAPKT